MYSLEELFCSIDDFCALFEPAWRRQLLENGKRCRDRRKKLGLSEIMTILISFHTSGCRNFKAFYLNIVSQYWQNAFPNLVSYQRFIDSTSIKVCHNRRIKAHRVFHQMAQRGKTSVDWFYGFKLHLAINDRGERTCPHLLLNVALSPGNVDDRKPVQKLLQKHQGKFYGDKGYISKALARELRKRGCTHNQI